MTTRIIGVDPGTSATGYGVLQGEDRGHGRLIECGVIRTKTRDPLSARLNTVYEGLTQVIDRLRPDALAVEGVFYGKNVRTTVALGHARGAVLLAAARSGIEVAEFPPATVKKTIVGVGNAGKAQVAFMVQRLLKLRTPPEPSDAADGVALALTYLLTNGR